MMDNKDDIKVFSIHSGKLSARVLNLGATLMELTLAMPEGLRPVILSLGSPEAYLDNPHYLGVIAGRCANRIRGGDCVIDGRSYQLDRNENGKTHLHGGKGGFSTRRWTLASQTDSAVELILHSLDGEQGYPGNVDVTCRYEALPDLGLRITLTATSDAKTLVNLAAHAYFNLSLGTSVLDHSLQVQAHHYTPIDADLIPDGRIQPVDGSCFDFLEATRIRARRSESAIGFDHNLVLAKAPRKEPKLAVTLISPSGDLSMDILTTEPSLQFYDGQKLSGSSNRLAPQLSPFAGCCLEPQRYPDAVHHPHFASSILERGEVYKQVTEYWFKKSNSV
jgi:aldose 1-epimerase